MLDRIRTAVVTFVWYHLFYALIIGVFFVGLELQQCSIFWIDRLYILAGIPVVTGLALTSSPGDWWARFFHGLLTALLAIFFLVIFFAYLLPNFVTANCQPDGVGIPNVCSGGKCDNPFNDLRWPCIFNNTNEAQACNFTCSVGLCEEGVSIEQLSPRFGHTWIFAFVIVFIVLMFVSWILLWYLNSLIRRARSEIAAGVAGQSSLGAELLAIDNLFPIIPGRSYNGPPRPVSQQMQEYEMMEQTSGRGGSTGVSRRQVASNEGGFDLTRSLLHKEK